MHTPNDWINTEYVKYFELEEFIDKIKLDNSTLIAAADTEEMFSEYIKHLSSIYEHDLEKLIFRWIDQGINEQVYSNKIENHKILFQDMAAADLFFEKLSISHERIKRIHKFVCERGYTNGSIIGDYRKNPVSIGTQCGDEYLLYWRGVEVENIKDFMNSFIKFYKTNSIKEIYNNPFLKSALAHLLFVRIHPFCDGNGRVARIIQNIAFTNGINRIYDTNLKLSPLNISQCINVSKIEYVDIINRMHFDLEYDNNELINRWFRYMLYKYQEQINYQTNRFRIIDTKVDRYLKEVDKAVGNSVEEMKLKKLIK